MDGNPKQHPNGTSQTSQVASLSFRDKVGRIILKSRLACSLPMPEPTESHLMADAWVEVLEGEVPEGYLEAAYLRAMRDKGNGFGLSANDLVQGYRDLCESERAAPQIPQNSRLLPGEVCQRCFGSGREQKLEGGYMVSRRCSH